MSATSSDRQRAERRSLQVALGYAAIAVFVLLSYVAVLGLYERFANEVLPHGDPFTYTNSLFRLLDQSRAHYFGTILAVIRGDVGGWYRLLQTPTALLAPILAKDPAILSVVNYLIWGLGTAAFFRLGHAIGLGVGRAFVAALIPWVWPVNYGFADYASIPVLALDASFTGALTLALGNSFVFALDPRSRLNGIIAAVSIGIAVWGRGNSAPVVALVVGWPCLLAVWNALRSKERGVWFNVTIAAALALAMTVEFYATYWRPITGYYSLHADFVERHHWNLRDALPYIKNIPGFMFWRSENSWLTMGLSWASHLVPLFALGVAWRSRAIAPERRGACRQLALAGALIYFGTYAADLALWTDPLINIYNALLIWRPMLIGLSLSVIVLYIEQTDPLRMRPDLRLLPQAGVAFLLWGAIWNAHNTPWEWGVGRPGPRTVERFALDIEPMLDRKGTLGMLWYRSWSAPILQYYRAKNDYPDLPVYRGKNWTDIWSQADYSAANRVRVLEEVKENFTNASLIVIGEYLDEYSPEQPYALYHFRQDWADWLNSPEAPRLRVRLILQDSPRIRLLVLQREELARGRGDPFRLPWGNRPKTPPADYSDAVVRFK